VTTRRAFLMGAAGLTAALTLPLRARAQDMGKRFVFVFAEGGWDTTQVFAPLFDAPVDIDPLAQPAEAGGIRFVDSALRPSVRSYFERFGAQSVVLNGMLVRSISHDICRQIALTGSSSGDKADWPARLAAAARDAYTLPHLVLSGPSFPGEFGAISARTGQAGQLDSLLSGRAMLDADIPATPPTRASERVVQAWLKRRGHAFAASGKAGELGHAYARSLERSSGVKDLQYLLDLRAGTTLLSQVDVAVDALKHGVARCVSISSGLNWDTHADNHTVQSANFELLFAGLNRLAGALAASPSPNGGTLADDTIIVMLSEMGRTPLLNGSAGKDHWPYTSALLMGKGLTGGRVIGGFDDAHYGLGVNADSGALDPSGEVLSAGSLGATLMALAGLDDPGNPVQAIRGVIA